ncbi:hypothetical protein HPB48_011888 [Haemaphysalis longicornis]|uniref:Uncharacterized protein n=1 Tax=Haemaphysalis longicornis TaxID=44386 RepID=A0A9J6FL51_HAELO|nr:hypothetical protein HPB48_011888 [Haemaphysalis longicornis]
MESVQIAEPTAPNDERVDRVIRQAQPTFAAYLRGARFRDLEERAAEAKRIQGHILASRAYRPLPPASEALEPRCAWKGASSFSRHPPDAAHAVGAEDKGLLEISERALDPYTYGRHTANARKKPATTALNSQVRRQAETLHGMPIAGIPVWAALFSLQKRGPHQAHCSQPPAQLGNAGAGRAGKPIRPSLGRPGYPVGGPAPFISVVIAGRESRLYGHER